MSLGKFLPVRTMQIHYRFDCGTSIVSNYDYFIIFLGWLKSLLPKSALSVEEEAWNAYPYTKTRYTCPFVEKFMLEIETYYFADNGHQENVFKLSGSELRNRIVGTYYSQFIKTFKKYSGVWGIIYFVHCPFNTYNDIYWTWLRSLGILPRLGTPLLPMSNVYEIIYLLFV